MTPDFIRKYHIYQLLAKTPEGNYVSKKSMQQSLTKLFHLHADDKLYEGLLKTNERTIRRDLNDIESFFGVDISYKRGAGYFIEDAEANIHSRRLIFDKMELFLASHKEQQWSPHVTTEESSLNTNIDILGLVNAIEKKVWIIISYRGWFDDDNFKSLKKEKVQALHIKQSYRGWYLLVYNEEIGVKVLCLDNRVVDLEISTEKVTTPLDFCVKTYFENSFGILNDHSKPEKIVLKVVNHHFRYLVSKPLHHSQKILAKPINSNKEVKNYSDDEVFGAIELFLQPNYEFIIELLKFNWWVKVEEPQWLAAQLVKQHQFILQEYYPTLSESTTL